MHILVMNVHAIETDQQRAENRPVNIDTDKDVYTCEKDKAVIVFISGNPNTEYTLVVTKPNGASQAYTVTTDGSGNATINIPLSTSAPSGTWTLVLYGEGGLATAMFVVKCDNKPTP
ncbi:MAG: hypothetical protein QXV18_01600, partial [Candidatus Nitrosocaldus sp.]